MIELRGIGLDFVERSVLDDFNLSISEGEKVVIRGKSGTGKSSLLRLVLGFVQPSRGEVSYRGQPLSPEIAWSLRREVAYVNQGVDLESGTVATALSAICRLRSCDAPPETAAMKEALAVFEFDASQLSQKTSELSGGEQQRIALAAALLLQREIVILDEPTASLDEGLTNVVAQYFLETYPGTTLVVSHDDAWFQPERATIVNFDTLKSIAA